MGFRGQHELQRHIERQHLLVQKYWVCQDPRLSGTTTRLDTQLPLSRCGQCSVGKRYDSDVAAAAHLHRTHFSGPSDAPSPPSQEMMNWIREIEVLDQDRRVRIEEAEDESYTGSPHRGAMEALEKA